MTWSTGSLPQRRLLMFILLLQLMTFCSPFTAAQQLSVGADENGERRKMQEALTAAEQKLTYLKTRQAEFLEIEKQARVSTSTTGRPSLSPLAVNSPVKQEPVSDFPFERDPLPMVQPENQDILPKIGDPPTASTSGKSEPRDQQKGAYNSTQDSQLAPQNNAESNSNLSQGAEKKADSESAAAAPEDRLKLSARWNNGLELQSSDKNFRVHVGGRYQMDAAWFSTAPEVQNQINVPYGDGVDFRRARFRIDGTLYKYQEWAAEVDFVNSFRTRNQGVTATNPGFADNAVTALTDFWWQFNEVPRLGSIRIGQQKEPIGFEHIVSSRFLPFMERSFNQDTFYGGTFNGFNPGVQAFRNYGLDEMGLVQLGLFKPVNTVSGFSNGDGDYSLTGRITRLLNYSDEGRYLTHVGLSVRQATAVSQAGVPGRIQSFRTRDAVRGGISGEWPVPAGIVLFGDEMQWVNAEWVAVRGPWTFQSEYLVSDFREARTTFGGVPDPSVTYHGGYLQLFRFLTDDYDRYNKKTGVFDRVLPRTPFRVPIEGCEQCNGIGAIQVGARYNYLDLNNSGLNGGLLHNLTLGVNWFLNPNMKLQTNYSATYRDVAATSAFPLGSGWIHGFGGRVAIDF